MEQKFDVAFVGIQIKDGKYVPDMRTGGQGPDAVLVIRGNKEFTIDSTLKITSEVNSYLPNLSTGEFKIKVAGIKFKCTLARR